MSLNKQEWENSKKFINGVTEKTIRGTAIQIFSEIIKQSPVKTGRFRGNWQTTLQKPATGVVQGAADSAASAIGEVINTTKQYKVGQTLFMTNNLPYAYALSQGSSKQRGRGWIERIIMGFQKTIDREAKKNK